MDGPELEVRHKALLTSEALGVLLCVGYAGHSQGFGGASSLYYLLGRPGGFAGHGRPESPSLTC